MTPKLYTEQEELDFMNNLLGGLSQPTQAVASLSRRADSRASASTSKPAEARKPPRTPVKTFSVQNEDIDILLEGAEEWDWDDMNSEVMTPKKVNTPKKPKARIIPFAEPPPTCRPETCTRCVVKALDEAYTTHHYQKALIVEVLPGNERRRVILQNDWAEADVRPGDIINVIGNFTVPPSSSTAAPIPSITINMKQNLFIHHPDLLITATALSSAPQCRRKPLLSNLVKSSVDATPALIWGNMLHEVMQSCLSEGRWDERWVNQKTHEAISQNLGELLKVDMSVEQALSELKLRAQGLKSFASKYISKSPKPDAVLTNTRAMRGETSLLAISGLHDVEEDIWSPTFGLKGKIDASVQAVITEIDDSSNPFAKTKPTAFTQSFTLPFEIKTGRAVAGMEHRAQTMLYTLLVAERYGTEVPSGLLYYTSSEEVVRVPAVQNELRALLFTRNDLAGYMTKRIRDSNGEAQPTTPADTGRAQEVGVFLPPTIDDAWKCGKCFVLDTCMLYRKAVEKVEDTTSPIADIYDLKTSHLTPTQGEFFKKWESLLSLEERDLVRFRKELWTMGAQERERHGRCFSDMVLLSSEAPTKSQGKIHSFSYRFAKSSLDHNSLLNGHMTVGDPITISVEPNMLAFVRGFIVDLTPQEVVVGADHEVDVEMIRVRTRTDGPVIFRIDKDELFGGMGRIRDNLAQLFYSDGDTRRLQLVVDLQAPRFFEGDDSDTRDLEHPSMAKLNAKQRLAVSKVINTQDYALILGMPGTGKTTVIAAVIQKLVSMGKTVLLTSYTHSAVDTILVKLKHIADFGILRLGNLDKIHPDVHEFTLANRRVATNLEQLETQVLTPPVVATTCLSIDHPLFARRKFDYCIVDEASQITLPTCLGPLRFAERFILVGDHFQLPPLVRNRAARKGGLDVSLFRRLSEAHPQAVIELTEQYRMNADIMLLSNKLIYNHRLQCGSETVAKRSLVLPDPDFLGRLHSGSHSMCPRDGSRCWLTQLLDESRKVVFVDSDRVPAWDSRVGDLVENQVEANLVFQITESLIHTGIKQNQIGILSLYRQQIKLLSYLLQDRQDVEIMTADRSQGRDKDCIIISMVRSNDEGQVGDLMKDWRRINVSFTRARSKLIVIGSRRTLQGTPLLREFFDLMESQGWILSLPAKAHQMHLLPPLTPKKRPAEGSLDDSVAFLENPHNRLLKKGKIITAEEGVIKGRPFLRDLVNDTR